MDDNDEAERKVSREKWEFYLLEILTELRRSWVKKPGKVKTSDFEGLFQFGLIDKNKGKQPKKEEVLTEEEKEKRRVERIAVEKYTWACIAYNTMSPTDYNKKRKKK